MGEAKRQRNLRHQVLTRFPNCIYCGGGVVATTVDHVPPRAVFDLRRRPQGLEFPACQSCNEGGRLDELAVAMLSRIYPDPITVEAQEEMKQLMQAVGNNHPGLLVEMFPTAEQSRKALRNRAQLPNDAHALNCSGPLVNRALHRFGAKLGYALHFQLTGKPVPLGGAANVWWFTNYQSLLGEVPDSLLGLLGGEPSTLRQGRWEVSGQFSYKSVGTPDGAMSAHLATFRFAFAICSFVAERVDKVRPPPGVDHVTLHLPGWLQGHGL
jgi:hypothetical protein